MRPSRKRQQQIEGHLQTTNIFQTLAFYIYMCVCTKGNSLTEIEIFYSLDFEIARDDVFKDPIFQYETRK